MRVAPPRPDNDRLHTGEARLVQLQSMPHALPGPPLSGMLSRWAHGGTGCVGGLDGEHGAVVVRAVEEVEVVCARDVLDEDLQLREGRGYGDVHGR